MSQGDPMNTDRRQFHIDKSISVGHILTTLGIAISAFIWASSIDQRVSQNSQSIEFINKNQARSDSRIDVLRAEIRQDLRDINGKLDRLIQSQAIQND